MSDIATLDGALRRLATALDQCEAAVERLAAASAEKRDLVDALALMDDDRGRLAGELDQAQDRARILEAAATEVAQRLNRAGGALRRMLAEAE